MARILLVEDERVTRRRLQNTLEGGGHEVMTAGTGAAALEQLTQERFDLVLADVWMPEMSGLELLKKLKELPARPRAIVITADDTPGTLLDAVKSEAYDYLTKPVDPEALLAVVAKAVSGGGEVPPIRVISAMPHWVELAVPCDRDAAERIQGFMAKLDTALSDEAREAVGRVFREMLLNAVEWGGKLDPSREVRVTYLRAKKMLLYRIADPGEGFRPEEIQHAAFANPEDQPMGHVVAREEKGLRPGGFGIVMSQSLADELLYNEARNEVVFIKYLDDDGGSA